MTIQPLTYNDLGLIKELQPAGWGDIFSAIEYYTRSPFCFPIKLILDKRIVGIGTAIIHNDAGWLAHIIVHPDNRKQGFGKLITETLVQQLHSKKIETIFLIATDLGAPVYEKIGFETETEYLFYKDIKPAQDYIRSKNIIPWSIEFNKQIAKLDKLVSGEDRIFHIEEFLENGYVYMNETAVEGFYLPTFGEGLIIANNAPAGIELMKHRFATKDTAVFPVDNLAAAAFMAEHNYASFRKAKRMRLGRKRKLELKNIYGRIGGNLG